MRSRGSLITVVRDVPRTKMLQGARGGAVKHGVRHAGTDTGVEEWPIGSYGVGHSSSSDEKLDPDL